MVILHGTWLRDNTTRPNGRFFVWGETREGYEKLRPRGIRKNVQPHPFQAAEHELIAALLDLSQGKYKGIPLVSPGLTKTRLLLPSTNYGPLPSAELKQLPIFRDKIKRDQSTPALVPWLVHGVTVSQVWVIDILGRLAGKNCRTAQGTIAGADFCYWGQVAKFALELLVRERFIPGVAEARSGSRACKRETAGARNKRQLQANWTALLDQGEDNHRVDLLAASMPPVCRAAAEPVPPRLLLEDFLHVSIDAMARHWLAKSPLEGRQKGLNIDSSLAKWAIALASENASFSGPPAELETLQEQIDNWTAPLLSQPGSVAFRTCFRLVDLEKPPNKARGQGKKAEEHNWQLQYLLQASDDPSLLVPAGKVWRERSSSPEFLNRRFANPQERLLTDLGLAARLFPPLEKSLASPAPEACNLTTTEAYTFLSEAASLLAESGFGVLLPSWWGQQSSRLGLRLRFKSGRRPGTASRKRGASASAGLGFETLLSYDWELMLGEAKLEAQEIKRLAALKLPLVQIRGQWVELRPDELAALASLKKKIKGTGTITLIEALRLSLTGQDTAGAGPGLAASEEIIGAGLPLVSIAADDDLAVLLQKLQGNHKIEILPQPQGFNGRLRPYQLRGFSWLYFLSELGLGACLADDMGLGKTIQLLALLLQRQVQEREAGPVLLICPTSVVGNWQREIKRFAPSLQVLLHHGSWRLSGQDFVREASKRDLVISTYSLAHRDEKDLLAVDWAGVVLDEAQNIKNPEAKQTRSICRLKAGFRVALTGTPVENHLGELWSIMQFLNPGYLGNQADFRKRFMIPIERYHDQRRAEQLRRLVQPFILRRVKTDPSIINDLPEKQEIKVFCHMTREQASLYEAVVQDMLHSIEVAEGIQRKGLILAALTKLKQICNHPAHFLGDGSALEDRSGKMTRLGEMLEEVLAAGERALIFTQFAVMGAMLQDYLQTVFEQEVLFLHGSVARLKREEMVRRFQEDRKGPSLFILSLKAGGVGLNLTRANHVFHYDRWWNPAVEDQATDRVFRIGQRKKVQVYKMICAGTLEEKIDILIEQKRALAQQIIGSSESWLTELSTQELRELLALNNEGVDYS
ncbi:MAG: DEAD/DEAH box helicase [Clostridia bacterium]|nr:DEAD/DEAH box helicase [Clostridia bacterium]